SHGECGLTYGKTAILSRRRPMARVSRRDFLTTSAGALVAVGAPRIGHAQTAVKVGTAVLGDYALAGPFIVAERKGFFKIEGLEGKASGVTSVGATTWVFARLVAKQQGWDPDRDVKIVGLGGLDAQLAALTRKEIHAYVWGDGGAVTQLAGKSKVLMRLDAVTPRWISQIQYASEDGIKKNADQIRKAQKAIFGALRFMKDQTNDAAKLV